MTHKEKPRVHTFSTTSKCPLWRMQWAAAGFDPVVLPMHDTPPKHGTPKQATLADRVNASHWLKRIQARENAPSLDGYLRWISTTLAAPMTQYVFMTQPDIFPSPAMLKKGLLNEAISRYATAGQIVLLARSDAVIGTAESFRRMCDLLAGDHGVTKENCTDGFIVRRVEQQMITFIVDIPSCVDQGEPGWQESPLPLLRVTEPHTLPATSLGAADFQTAFMEATKP